MRAGPADQNDQTGRQANRGKGNKQRYRQALCHIGKGGGQGVAPAGGWACRGITGWGRGRQGNGRAGA